MQSVAVDFMFSPFEDLDAALSTWVIHILNICQSEFDLPCLALH